jgi:hypothetical protein
MDTRVINKLEASLTDDARVVIYDCHLFIVQATYFLLRLSNSFLLPGSNDIKLFTVVS